VKRRSAVADCVAVVSSIVYLSDNNQKLKCRTYERIRKCNISTIKITNTNINTNKNTKSISV
jgi:hypothetical protein